MLERITGGGEGSGGTTSVVDEIAAIIEDPLSAIETAFDNIYSWITRDTTDPTNEIGWLGLQHGGLVTKPTLAMVGEGGPEAVIPLNKSGVMGNNITIIINEPHVQDEAALNDLARDIANRIEINDRRGA